MIAMRRPYGDGHRLAAWVSRAAGRRVRFPLASAAHLGDDEDMTSTFRLRPIDPAVADELRRHATETRIADAEPGFPCRQCLQDAHVGDELVLVSYDPFDAGTTSSPYRSASPIYLHAHSCTAPDVLDDLPQQLTRRRLSVRAFDRAAMMRDASVVDGDQLAAQIDAMFADHDVDHLQVHNAGPGCWAVRVERAELSGE
jgi:Protein of unknown function (DUF1203)